MLFDIVWFFVDDLKVVEDGFYLMLFDGILSLWEFFEISCVFFKDVLEVVCCWVIGVYQEVNDNLDGFVVVLL